MLHSVQKRGGVPPSSFDQRAAVATAALVLAVWLGVLGAPVALAQTPTASPIVPTTDTRSEGVPPALIGSPLVAALLVVAAGATAAIGTYVYVRLVARR